MVGPDMIKHMTKNSLKMKRIVSFLHPVFRIREDPDSNRRLDPDTNLNRHLDLDPDPYSLYGYGSNK